MSRTRILECRLPLARGLGKRGGAQAASLQILATVEHCMRILLRNLTQRIAARAHVPDLLPVHNPLRTAAHPALPPRPLQAGQRALAQRDCRASTANYLNSHPRPYWLSKYSECCDTSNH